MNTQDPSTQSPTKSTDSQIMASSENSKSIPTNPSESIAPPLSKEEIALILSLRDAIIPYESSIPLSLRIANKGTHITCHLLLNHLSIGTLSIPVDQYPYFTTLLGAIGCKITDSSSNDVRDAYLQFEDDSLAD